MDSNQDIIFSIISSIKSDSTKSENQKEEMLKFITKHDSFKNSTNHLEEKFEALLSFIKFIEHNVPQSSCKIYGSFVRQMFEKMFLSTYDESGYGDSENHDVDMHIFESKEKYNEFKTEFNNIIDTFEVMEKLDFDANIKFGNFYLVRIMDLTLNVNESETETLERMKKTLSEYIIRYNNNNNVNPINIDDEELPSRSMMYYRKIIKRMEQTIKDKFDGLPHFNIILKNPSNNKYIIIDMLGFPIKQNDYDISSDINVNTLCITHNGIESKSDFFDTIRSIYKRNGIMKVDMNKMVEDLHKPLLFSEKTKLYNNFVNFIGFRTKILSVGYSNIFSDNNKQICDIYVEEKETCPITSARPPYLVLNLECEHNISIMALAGIANIRQSDYSEAINCPICRAKLIPKMVDKQLTNIDIPDPSIVSDIFIKGQSRRNSININISQYKKNEIMSKDNINVVFEHLGLKDKVEDKV
jgi:hypothetical protein